MSNVQSLKLQRLVDVIEYSRVYLALGITLWAFALALLLQVTVDRSLAVVMFATIFGVYALNGHFDRAEDAVNRAHATPRQVTRVSVLGLLTLVSAVWVAVLRDPVLLALIGFILGTLICYSLAIFPASWGYTRLKEVPGVKNLTVATGLTGFICGSLIVGSGAAVTPSVLVLVVFLFLRFVIVSIIPDIRDMAGDRAAGVRTIPLCYGVQRTKRLLYGLNGVVTAVFYGALLAGWLPPLAAIPGGVNVLSFLLIGALTRENAQVVAILSDVNDTYMFFVLTALAVWEANGGMIP